MNVKTLFISTIFAVLLLSNCDRCKTVPEPVVCGEGYELVNETCTCPEGRFEAFGTCRALRENEYFGVASGCFCPDTIFFLLSPPKYNVNVGQLLSDIKITVDKDNVDFGGGDARYFELPTGDSIVAEPFPACLVGDKYYVPLVRGKKIGTDSLYLKIYYVWKLPEPDQVIDSCEVYLHR